MLLVAWHIDSRHTTTPYTEIQDYLISTILYIILIFLFFFNYFMYCTVLCISYIEDWKCTFCRNVKKARFISFHFFFVVQSLIYTFIPFSKNIKTIIKKKSKQVSSLQFSTSSIFFLFHEYLSTLYFKQYLSLFHFITSKTKIKMMLFGVLWFNFCFILKIILYSVFLLFNVGGK